ncbi:FAD-dependent thymidylate synthase [Corynebacterium uropygiale]|uniref:FAD-dependent thymidylate synthase n=1 Tax=Corynebacterium uropygiale TaxID=1775911 RepID=A0A9X1QQ84_9CORY|nr:FAD-dependent thymidylate synthase [Corynebacterium uropygiale]MCF4006437.1 FAD-dependent thymidylate synthase [Corynebacterium uropygiale]
MVSIRSLEVQLIGVTQFRAPQGCAWEAGKVSGPEALVEFASRVHDATLSAPASMDHASYLRTVIEVGRTRLLEHSSATLYVRGVSRRVVDDLRSVADLELTEMRHGEWEKEPVIALSRELAGKAELRRIVESLVEDTRFMAEELGEVLAEELSAETNRVLRDQRVRAMIRTVAPQCLEVPVVATGSMAQWRRFIETCAHLPADPELGDLARSCLRVLAEESPALWADVSLNWPET